MGGLITNILVKLRIKKFNFIMAIGGMFVPLSETKGKVCIVTATRRKATTGKKRKEGRRRRREKKKMTGVGRREERKGEMAMSS